MPEFSATTIPADSYGPLEFNSTVFPSKFLENLATQRSDANIGIETVASVPFYRSDALLQISFRASQGIDNTISFEQSLRRTADSLLLDENIFTGRSIDHLASIEARLTQNSDTLGEAEFNSSNAYTAGRSIGELEYTTNSLRDNISPLYFLWTRSQDSITNLSFLSRQPSDINQPIDFITNAIARQSDSSVALELLALRPRDSLKLIEYVYSGVVSIHGDMILPIEFLHLVPIGKPLEFLSQAQAHSLIDIEVGGLVSFQLVVDPTLPIEYLASQVVDLPNKAPLLPITGFVRRIYQQPDGTYIRRLFYTKIMQPGGGAFAEFNARQRQDYNTPFELMSLVKDPLTDTMLRGEFLSRSQSDPHPYFEFGTTARKSRRVYLENLGTPQIPIFATNHPIEWLDRLLRDHGSYFNFLSDSQGNPILTTDGQYIILYANTAPIMVILTTADGIPVTDENGNYVLVNTGNLVTGGIGWETQPRLQSDFADSWETAKTQQSDSPDRIEFAGRGQSIVNINELIEFLARSRIDNNIPTEQSARYFSAAKAGIDFLSTRRYDSSYPQLELLWRLAKDDNALLEQSGNISVISDQLLMLELLRRSTSDPLAYLEWVWGTERADAIIQLDNLISGLRDQAPLVELLASRGPDSLLPTTILSRRASDLQGDFEYSTQQSIDQLLRKEFAKLYTRDNIYVIDILSRNLRDVINPTEFTGFILKFSDSLLLAELLARQSLHSQLSTEFLLSVRGDINGAIELIHQTYADPLIPISASRRMMIDANVYLENFLSVTSAIDARLLIESISATITLDRIVNKEYLHALLTDSVLIASLNASAAGRLSGRIEFLSSKVLPAISPLSILAQPVIDSSLLISVQDLAQRHVIIPSEIYGTSITFMHALPLETNARRAVDSFIRKEFSGAVSVGADQIIIIETLHSQKGDHRALIDYVNATVQRLRDSFMYIEFNVSTVSDAQVVVDSLMSRFGSDVNVEIEYRGVPAVTLLSSPGRLARSIKIRITPKPRR